jgi:hypothetical protein
MRHRHFSVGGRAHTHTHCKRARATHHTRRPPRARKAGTHANRGGWWQRRWTPPRPCGSGVGRTQV